MAIRIGYKASAEQFGPRELLDFSIEAEMISACGYLGEDGVACSLHGRHRADGRTAKPDLCFEWPPKGQGLHPGCVFSRRPKRNARRPA